MVSVFADQFVKMEAENAQLRQELAAAKSSAERVEAANRLTEEAWQKNDDLTKELAKVKAELEEEVKQKEAAKTLAEEREERLRRAVESLLGKLLFGLVTLNLPSFVPLQSVDFFSCLNQLLPILLWITRTEFRSRPWRTPSLSPRTQCAGSCHQPIDAELSQPEVTGGIESKDKLGDGADAAQGEEHKLVEYFQERGSLIALHRAVTGLTHRRALTKTPAAR